MFFIGIFGVQSKAETIKTEAGVSCPICSAWDRYEIVKHYDYFHIFFIPVYRWNKRYFIKTRCCQRICSLDERIGSRIEAGESVTIGEEHITCSEQQKAVLRCSHCQRPLEAFHRYCPYCGTQV